MRIQLTAGLRLQREGSLQKAPPSKAGGVEPRKTASCSPAVTTAGVTDAICGDAVLDTSKLQPSAGALQPAGLLFARSSMRSVRSESPGNPLPSLTYVTHCTFAAAMLVTLQPSCGTFRKLTEISWNGLTGMPLPRSVSIVPPARLHRSNHLENTHFFCGASIWCVGQLKHTALKLL